MQTTERQKEIVTKAFTLIASQGIQELTIKNLAKAIGTSEPAIYRHFDSKAAILSAIVDEIIAVRNAAWHEAVSERKTAREKLIDFFSRQALSFESFPSLAIILFPDMLFRQDPDLLERIRAMIEETNDHIRELLKAGIEEGSFRKDLDRDNLSLLLIGGFRMLVSRWRMNGVPGTAADALTEQTRRYLQSSLSLIDRNRD